MKDKEKQIKIKRGELVDLLNQEQEELQKARSIEEMARVIDDRLIEARCWLGSMNRGKGYWIAEKLVEHYQPKLPKDSVVLSKEEYEKLKYTWITDSDAYKKGCKETAEKILKEFEYCNDTTFYSKWLELCKQFGLEIKE